MFRRSISNRDSIQKAVALAAETDDHHELMLALDELAACQQAAGETLAALATGHRVNALMWRIHQSQTRQLVNEVWARADLVKERRQFESRAAEASRSAELRRLRAQDLRGRDDLVLEDLLPVVEVVEEQVERGDPLDEARLEPRPLPRRDYAGDQVKGEDALGALRVVVDGERHSPPQEGEVDRGPPPLELGDCERGEALGKEAVMGPHFAAGRVHLVEELSGVVVGA